MRMAGVWRHVTQMTGAAGPGGSSSSTRSQSFVITTGAGIPSGFGGSVVACSWPSRCGDWHRFDGALPVEPIREFRREPSVNPEFDAATTAGSTRRLANRMAPTLSSRSRFGRSSGTSSKRQPVCRYVQVSGDSDPQLPDARSSAAPVGIEGDATDGTGHGACPQPRTKAGTPTIIRARPAGSESTVRNRPPEVPRQVRAIAGNPPSRALQ